MTKGQTNSKLFFQANVSSKRRTNKFDFTICQLVFVHFLEESEDTKKTFRNQLTFSYSNHGRGRRQCFLLVLSKAER